MTEKSAKRILVIKKGCARYEVAKCLKYLFGDRVKALVPEAALSGDRVKAL